MTLPVHTVQYLCLTTFQAKSELCTKFENVRANMIMHCHLTTHSKILISTSVVSPWHVWSNQDDVVLKCMDIVSGQSCNLIRSVLHTPHPMDSCIPNCSVASVVNIQQKPASFRRVRTRLTEYKSSLSSVDVDAFRFCGYGH